MKRKIKIVVMTLIAIFILAAIPQNANAQQTYKKHNAAVERLSQFGENDPETMALFNEAVECYKKKTKAKNLYSYGLRMNFGSLYHTFGKYDEALNLMFEVEKFYLPKKNNTKKTLAIPSAYQIHGAWPINIYNYAGFLADTYIRIGSVYYSKEDFAMAHQYFKLAAETSNELSAGLAHLYWLGIGVEQDLYKAMELYRISDARDSFWSCIYYIDYQIKEYEKGNFDNKAIKLYMDFMHLLRASPHKKDLLMSILTEAADLGYPPAQVDLWIYYNASKDYSKGMPYLQMAVDNGFVPAYYHLGWSCFAKRDYYEAKRWFEMAAKEGYPLAQVDLGKLYEFGYISNNSSVARFWYNQAAQQGSVAAKYRLSVLNAQAQTQQASLAEMITKTISDIANTALDIYNKVDKSKVQAYTPPSQRTSTGSPSSTPSSSSDKPCNCGYSEATVYNNNYNADRSRLMDMNIYREKYNDNDRKRFQADMKRTREEFNSRCCNLSPISKDDWEDWDGKKR